MTVAPAVRQRIADNVAGVRERVACAAQRSGRDAAAVTLVAVTKYVDADLTRVLFECGCSDLGESRPQQLWSKAETLADLAVRWHLIGHLQRNKLARVLPHVALVHSIDSERLWSAAADWTAAQPHSLPALLEVNVSGDASKHGFLPHDMADFLRDVIANEAGQSGLQLRGLMAMASLAGGLDRARQDFRALRELRDRLVSDLGVELTELSMGMSGDFEVAIEEGATIVRVGSLLFEGIDG